jgi:hypothetical protein
MTCGTGLSAQISEQLAVHADQHVFTSLPRSGRSIATSLTPRLPSRARRPAALWHPGCRDGHDARQGMAGYGRAALVPGAGDARHPGMRDFTIATVPARFA